MRLDEVESRLPPDIEGVKVEIADSSRASPSPSSASS